MARARMLSKSLGCSRRFNAVQAEDSAIEEFSQLLFTMLIPHVDDYGRITGDPLSIKLSVLPASRRSVEEFRDGLRVLHTVGLIVVYEAGGDIWLQVNKFEDHQRGLNKRTPSHIPPVPKNSSGNFPGIPENPGISQSCARAEENRTELKGTELKGIEKNKKIRVISSSADEQFTTLDPFFSGTEDTAETKAMLERRRADDATRRAMAESLGPLGRRKKSNGVRSTH